jgi:hypothetical protein
MSPAQLVVDVFPADLRRRLNGAGATTSLPGGVVLEESGSYRLDAEGEWSMVQIAGEWHFSHSEGHVVVLNQHGLTVTPGC